MPVPASVADAAGVPLSLIDALTSALSFAALFPLVGAFVKLAPDRGGGILGFTAVAVTLDTEMGVESCAFVPEFAAAGCFATVVSELPRVAS
jgi:hypothetical protein